ncbi:MAG: xanthine dehydrogenase family protein molybdopterin-binding subunit [Acidobacteria bacterium]|nr:xanthine dehydrogenase family protein molybdopterin-binding subunit [Acidobacteriota bacterium]
MSYGKIGQPLGRVEGPAKVTGEAKYTADVLLPGMIWGKVLRSPLPHAKIVSIDTREAEQMPGILAVLTAKDLPDLLIGRRVYDMPVLAKDQVRFIGEKVVVVAAEDPDVAEDALAYIDVEYEDMPAVFDAHEAMKPEAPLLHPDYRSYAHAPEKFFSDIPNVHSHVTWELGDIEKGFALAKQVFEHTFNTPAVHQGYIEPHASVVAIDPDGRVNVWISNKMPVRARELLADVVEIPQERIVVHLAQIGADFGGKGSLMDAPLCYHLAKRTGRPVKMVMTYTEELMAGNPRHPTSVFLRTGVTEKGQIVARQAKVVFDSGAYAAFKPVPFVNIPGAKDAAGVYGTPHIRIDAYSVYTNCVPSGHFRAPGDLQVNFAVESSMDMIAEDLGLDRLEFRKQNLLKDGDWVPGGPQLEEVRVAETLAAAVKASSWNQPKSQPNRGLGLAVSHRLIGTGEANTQLTLKEDGTIQVLTPVPEVGTGAHTILQQIVAETLFLPLDQIRVETASDIFKTDSGSGASRVTYVGGQVVQQAAGELMKLILAVGAKGLGCAENEVVFEGGRVVHSDSDGSLSLAEVAKIGGDGKSALRVKKSLNLSEGPPVTTFTAQVVELEVDPETGQIKLLDVVTAHDVGTIINPLGHQGQIEGGLLQGVGFGLIEELRMEDGQVSTLNLGDYKLPNIRDIPPLTTVLVEEEVGPAPFHGKAIGESSITPTGAAIANAVYDAVGVRFHDLPITAEKVYWALRQQSGGKG